MSELLEILTQLHPEVDFTNCETLIDDGILDSFDVITIVSEIHANLDVVIPAGEIIPENFNSLQRLSQLVRRLQEECR